MRKINLVLMAVMVWGMAGVPGESGVAKGQAPGVMEDQHIFASDGQGGPPFGHWFGISVSASDEVALVGSQNGFSPSGIATGSAYIYRFNGTNWIEEAKLFASDGLTGDEFGISVSIRGNVAVVGARADDIGVVELVGSAYVYRFNGTIWVEEAHLFASDGASGDLFGQSVSVSGIAGSEVVIVGANQDDTSAGGIDAGSIYFYRFNGTTWGEEAHLFATDGAAGDKFGSAVQVSGTSGIPGSEIALVGASSDDTGGGSGAGSAYIYRFNGATWLEEAHLFASDGAAFDSFGESVSINGTTGSEVAIVGASFDDTGDGPNAGSVYLFRKNGAAWGEEAHLFSSHGAAVDRFGASVSIRGTPGIPGAPGSEVAMVGAIQETVPGGVRAGAVYAYRHDGTSWVEEARLLASDGADFDRFGVSVAISGSPGEEFALVGAWSDDTWAGIDAGSGYIFNCVGGCTANAVLDPGQSAVMNPGGGSGVLTDDALVDATNVSGAAGSTVTASETIANQFPGGGGFGVFDSQLDITTTMNDGQFFMQLSIPFAQADLDGGGIADPLTMT